MARDPRKNSAFDSGMRGREKPKVTESHGRTANPEGAKGGEKVAKPHGQVGDPEGVDQNDSAYTSGMRGPERPKQKPASGAANEQPAGREAAGNRADPHTTVSKPEGEENWQNDSTGPKKNVGDDHLRQTAENAYDMGIPGNSTEEAAEGADHEPEGIIGEEDDTHINVKIPKASLKRKMPGVSTS